MIYVETLGTLETLGLYALVLLCMALVIYGTVANYRDDRAAARDSESRYERFMQFLEDVRNARRVQP